MTPEGDFEAVIHAAYLGFDWSGNDAACLELDIHSRSGVTTERWVGAFDGERLARTVKALRICGWTGDDLETIRELTGRKVSVGVVHRKKGEKTYANIYINPRKQMDPHEAKTFAASMKRLIAEVSQPESATEFEAPTSVLPSATPPSYAQRGHNATPAPPADPDDYEITPEDRAAAKAFDDAQDAYEDDR